MPKQIFKDLPQTSLPPAHGQTGLAGYANVHRYFFMYVCDIRHRRTGLQENISKNMNYIKQNTKIKDL